MGFLRAGRPWRSQKKWGHNKGTLLGTPNREPQEYSRYIIGIYLPGSLYSIIFLLYSWGSLFGVPSRVPLHKENVGGAIRDHMAVLQGQ